MITATASAPPVPIAPARPNPQQHPRGVLAALVGLLVGTALLYLWGLGASGYANTFYSAAVQAGTTGWKAFFFGSSDGANSIMVDKPPASLWVMELSARIFGVNSWSILVPQALEGVAAVGVLYAAVRRWHGPVAGLLAGAVLALTPVAVLMFRFNNPDALLVLMLTLAAYALVRAVEAGRTSWLVTAAACLGLGFLTKMLQAFLVVPGFALAYLVAAPVLLRRRITQLLVAGVALVASSGWWVATVALWPAADRPYVGGSQTNSILELIFGYNGFGRLTGNETGSVGGGAAGAGRFGGGPFGGGRFGGGSMFGGGGLRQLFDISMGSQIAWLLPAALLFLVTLLWLGRRLPRTDRLRASMLLWGGWLLVTGAVLSFAQGIVHPYYTVALAPAIGALIGIGAVALWQRRAMLLARAVLAAGLAGTVAWAFVLLERVPSWQPWLRVVVLLGGLACAVGLALPGSARRGSCAVGGARSGARAGRAGCVRRGHRSNPTPRGNSFSGTGGRLHRLPCRFPGSGLPSARIRRTRFSRSGTATSRVVRPTVRGTWASRWRFSCQWFPGRWFPGARRWGHARRLARGHHVQHRGQRAADP